MLQDPNLTLGDAPFDGQAFDGVSFSQLALDFDLVQGTVRLANLNQ
jgi:hypothetical protein